MPVHTVLPGECLVSIADRYGFCDPLVIYHRPENEALRRARPDPNVLLAGDEVYVPDRELRSLTLAPERRHQLRVKTRPVFVRLRLLDAGQRPRANLPWTVEVQGARFSGHTDGNGVLEQRVPAGAVEAVVTVGAGAGEQRYRVALGYMDPEDTPSGLAQRLENLGFLPADETLPDDLRLRHAVMAFQSSAGLPATGEPDAATRTRLRERHGS